MLSVLFQGGGSLPCPLCSACCLLNDKAKAADAALGGDEGMREGLVSHNSAKLEVNCRFCGQVCFCHYGLLRRKPDLTVWLSFSFCLSLQQTCHPSSAVTIYFDRMFGKESETILRELTWRFTARINKAPCTLYIYFTICLLLIQLHHAIKQHIDCELMYVSNFTGVLLCRLVLRMKFIKAM